MGTSRSSRVRLIAVTIATVFTVLLVAESASAELRFRDCDREGHEAFECARMNVPLKLPQGRPRGALGTQTIKIHVERLKSSRDMPVALLALAGGPGQAATDFAPQFADELEPAYEGDKQLVVIDQRGTGGSGFLDCKGDGRVPTGRGVAALGRCSREIGPRGRWYRTADSVADIEKLRQQLGVEQLAIYGVQVETASGSAKMIGLRRYSAVSGVRISGRLELSGEALNGSLRVRGSAAAHGRLRVSDGRIHGKLDGRQIGRVPGQQGRRRIAGTAAVEPLITEQLPGLGSR